MDNDVIHRITYLIQYYYIILFSGCQRFRLNFLVEKIYYASYNTIRHILYLFGDSKNKNAQITALPIY